MRRFLLGWKHFGFEERYGVIVNYADDFVICCREQAAEAMGVMRRMMAKLDLTVNEDKTRICRVAQDSFDFLGFTIGQCHDPVQQAVEIHPSWKSGRKRWPSRIAPAKAVSARGHVVGGVPLRNGSCEKCSEGITTSWSRSESFGLPRPGAVRPTP